ncbi:MAG TPA: hypothetical protein VH562_06265 [Nitrosopumilaceae archaeon]
MTLEHVLFSDGNAKGISWTIQTGESKVEQKRDHADLYVDRVTDEQSKYIALHVGIFWCIGTFRIKNGDRVNVMLDLKSMYEHLAHKSKIFDDFIEARTDFINQLIAQRKLDIHYHLIDSKENLASNLLKIS